jgi:hypothetical protein
MYNGICKEGIGLLFISLLAVYEDALEYTGLLRCVVESRYILVELDTVGLHAPSIYGHNAGNAIPIS